MKKLLLFFLLSFAIITIFTDQANAQTKSINCEEWKSLATSEKCKYYVVKGQHANQTKNFDLWCFSQPAVVNDQGSSYDLVVNTQPPGYIAAFEWTTCGSTEKNLRQNGESFPVSELDETNDKKSSLDTPKQETRSATQTIDDWIMENDLVSDPARIEQMERERNELYQKKAELKEAMFEKAQQMWKSETIKLQAELRSELNLEFVWEGQWPDVKTAVFDAESGAIIKSDSWRNIYIQDLADQITKKVVLQQGEMEIKVINANPTENKVSVEVDDFFDLFVIQTHFWVRYDPDKKLGVINVYEGQVEVKTKDGKTVKVMPNGDKPGVVVITRKLSIQKLIRLGLVVAAIIGGGMFLLNRKFVAKVSSKKRR